jgi:hypothetical protein
MTELAWLTDAVARTEGHTGRIEDEVAVLWDCGDGPNGPVQVWWRVEAGRVVEAVADGGGIDAECCLTLPYAQAEAVANGDVDPAVLFMQGMCKTEGDDGAVLRALPAASASARARAR